jgi:hypothetical protein
LKGNGKAATKVLVLVVVVVVVVVVVAAVDDMLAHYRYYLSWVAARSGVL